MARGKDKEPPVRPVAQLPVPPVQPSDAAARKFSTAIAGEPRDVLMTMREHLAARLDDGVPAAYVVNVMRMLRDTDNAIRQLDDKAKAEADAERGERRTWDSTAI